MKKYMTPQRKALLEFLRQHPNQQFSVEEIAESLCGQTKISLSSIYRNIKDLEHDGSVDRTSTGSGKSLYQYRGGKDCDSHVHLKCENCGQLFHLDDSSMALLRSALTSKEGFHINPGHSTLYGSCENCRGDIPQHAQGEK